MRFELVSNHKGKLVNAKASCDKCQYTCTLELPYANMQTVAYEPPPLPQPIPLPVPGSRAVEPAAATPVEPGAEGAAC
jgi:hypothetical protein